jgi:PTH1 family peptidyl-tRNA hydrolase
MKYLIAGLGNIGPDYHDTRHNVGFMVADLLASEYKANFQSARYADKAEFKIKGRSIVLIKPTTYMNLSGKAIRYWLTKENVEIENVLIIVDDIALPLGTLRLREKGSDGGHNGLADIITQLCTQQFYRLRFGVGGDFPKGYQVEYVLGKWTPDEKKLVTEKATNACKLITSFVFAGPARTMTDYNNK